MPTVHILYTLMGCPIPNAQRVCPMMMGPHTGSNMTTRFNPIAPLLIYGKLSTQLGQKQKSLTAEPGPTIQALIL